MCKLDIEGEEWYMCLHKRLSYVQTVDIEVEERYVCLHKTNKKKVLLLLCFEMFQRLFVCFLTYKCTTAILVKCYLT